MPSELLASVSGFVVGSSGTQVIGRIHSSSLDDSPLPLLTNGFVFRVGWMSLKWRGLPPTSTACSLTMPVICPLRKLVVHRLLGGFTQTVSPNSYGPLVPRRSGRYVNALDAHSVVMDCIGGCARSSHSILCCCIISIDRFHNRARLPGCDPLHASVAPLWYVVATRHVCTSVSEPDPPLIYEMPKLRAAEVCVVVCEDLFRRSPFVKYGLQFTDDTGGVLSY